MAKQGKFIKSKNFAISAISLAIILAALIFISPQEAASYASKTQRRLPIYCVDREDKKISISFDCAWGVEHTDEILNYLDEYGVKCTFFAVQFWVEKYPEYVKKIVERGHEIGTHSATHSHMSKLSESQIEKELISSKTAVEKLTNTPVELFRPPFGEYDDKLILTAQKLNLYTIQWDVDSLDWKDLSKEKIAERVLKRVKSGSIILCHNNGLHTAEALPMIFSVLKEQGYEFVPISRLIYREDYKVDGTGKQVPLNL